MKKFFVVVCGALLLFGCGDDDDDSSSQSNAQQVDSSITSYNSAQSSAMQTHCDCYADATHNGDVNACVNEYNSAISLSSCQKAAAECNAASFTSWLDCAADAQRSYGSCVSSCPSTQADLESCANTFDTQLSNCDSHITDQLRSDINGCDSGQTPTCDSSGGGGGGGSGPIGL